MNFWRAIADFGSWLIELGISHGAYRDEWSEEQIEAESLAQQRLERERYEADFAEGYAQGRHDERYK